MLKTLIDRPVTITMMMLVVVVIGLVCTSLLPVSLIPDIDIPYITVKTVSQNMSAREIDESVLKTLRHQMMQVNGLENLSCEACDMTGTLSLTFSHGTDMDYAFVEVNEVIDRCMPSLYGIERPMVIKANASDIPAFYLNITRLDDSKESFKHMSGFANDVIRRRLEQLPEIAMVDISGYTKEEILVIPESQKLDQLGLSIERFEEIIHSSNIHLGSLTIKDGQYRYSMNFQSDLKSFQDIANVRFAVGERILQLKDVAQIQLKTSARTGLVRSDGKDAVCLAIIKQSDAKMSDLRKDMDRLIEEFASDYPNLTFTITRDQTRLLEYSINNLIKNIIAGIILTCLVIFLFMKDVRSSALVCLTMPVALIFSMGAFYAFGISINIISLSGLLLGVGMMMDNSIILVDNISSRWRKGEDLRDAVIRGTKEVMAPMLSSILTTCAIFIPLVFIQGTTGDLFYDQAMAITIVLLTSYIVTLTVTPVFYYRWNLNSAACSTSGRQSFDKSMQHWDKKVTLWFLEHRGLAWSILLISVLGVCICFIFIPKERLPQITQTEAIMNIKWNEQISIDENERRTVWIEDIIKEDCIQITSMIGMQDFILNHMEKSGVGETSIYVGCTDMNTLEKIKVSVKEAVKNRFPSSTVGFKNSENIFDAVFADRQPSCIAKLSSADGKTLEVGDIREVLDIIKNELPEKDIDNISLKKDVLFIADQEKMLLYDISYNDLSLFLKNSLNENRLFTLTQGSRSIPVIIGTETDSIVEILSEGFIIKDDYRIPVSEIMRQTYVEDFKTLFSGTGGSYYPVTLEADTDMMPQTIDAVRRAVNNDGKHNVSFEGSWFTSRKLIKDLIFVLMISIVLLYLILASQFESLLQPWIILSEIVIDMFFSLLVLWILGININLMSMIGLIVVCGIVINDSILKVDTINRMRREGAALKDAIIQAGGLRMKAIIMTSLTTILSVCPFLTRGNIGDDLQYPMSVVIIAGMTVGTLVSMFVLPALYFSIYKRREK